MFILKFGNRAHIKYLFLYLNIPGQQTKNHIGAIQTIVSSIAVLVRFHALITNVWHIDECGKKIG